MLNNDYSIETHLDTPGLATTASIMHIFAVQKFVFIIHITTDIIHQDTILN